MAASRGVAELEAHRASWAKEFPGRLVKRLPFNPSAPSGNRSASRSSDRWIGADGGTSNRWKSPASFGRTHPLSRKKIPVYWSAGDHSSFIDVFKGRGTINVLLWATSRTGLINWGLQTIDDQKIRVKGAQDKSAWLANSLWP